MREANRDHFQIAEPRHPAVVLRRRAPARLIADLGRADAGAFADGELVGFARLSNVVLGAFRNAYLGYMVGRAHGGPRRRDAARPPRGRARVGARPAPRPGRRAHDNPGSLRVMEKAGFRREGLALNYLELDGAWRDHMIHAVTREDSFDLPDLAV